MTPPATDYLRHPDPLATLGEWGAWAMARLELEMAHPRSGGWTTAEARALCDEERATLRALIAAVEAERVAA